MTKIQQYKMDGTIDGDLGIDDDLVDNIQDEARNNISAAHKSWLALCQLSLGKGEVRGKLDLETLINREEQKFNNWSNARHFVD